MSLALVAVLVIGGLVGALALIVLVPLTFGLMAYDVVDVAHRPACPDGECEHTHRR